MQVSTGNIIEFRCSKDHVTYARVIDDGILHDFFGCQTFQCKRSADQTVIPSEDLVPEGAEIVQEFYKPNRQDIVSILATHTQSHRYIKQYTAAKGLFLRNIKKEETK